MPQNRNESEELIIRGPVLVPTGWLVAIVGAAATGVGLAFSIGLWVAAVSNKTEAHESAIQELQKDHDRVVRIETILAMVYPEQARQARQRIPAQKEEP